MTAGLGVGVGEGGDTAKAEAQQRAGRKLQALIGSPTLQRGRQSCGACAR